MNILSHIHIHRLPNPSGVGRVIDSLLTTHAAGYPDAVHRMLVDRTLYDAAYPELSAYWKKVAAIPHAHSTSAQQALWIGLNQPSAERYWKAVDVVYCPAESYVPTRKARLICTIHDVAGFEESLYPRTRSQRMHCLKWRVLFRRMAQHADAVVTVSNYSATRIAHYFPALENKLTVIHNAPHPVFGSVVEEALQQEVMQLSGGAPFILVPGGLSFRKNADVILKALPLLMKALPEVKVVVAGKNNTGYIAQLDAMDCSHVILAGYVSDALLNALYQRAQVVWFPSRYEGFGMPALEAMAAGVPVVASHIASLPEVVGDAAVLCNADNPEEHVEAMVSIVSSSRSQESMRSRGLLQAKEFTWAASAQKLETLFQSV
jgi:glycosyltransferase involved in cell wall biosynthesis